MFNPLRLYFLTYSPFYLLTSLIQKLLQWALPMLLLWLWLLIRLLHLLTYLHSDFQPTYLIQIEVILRRNKSIFHSNLTFLPFYPLTTLTLLLSIPIPSSFNTDYSCSLVSNLLTFLLSYLSKLLMFFTVRHTHAWTILRFSFYTIQFWDFVR